jgi:hypothetical protein
MLFMALSSSGENEIFSMHFTESVTGSGLLTPISTDVIRSSFNIHESAIFQFLIFHLQNI